MEDFTFVHRKDNIRYLGAITEVQINGQTVKIARQNYGYWGNKKGFEVYEFLKKDILGTKRCLHYDKAAVFAVIVLAVAAILASVWYAWTLPLLYLLTSKHSKLIIQFKNGSKIDIIEKKKRNIEYFQLRLQQG
ncbi:hypothetical protein [Aminipila sp.]|uniref:hypothetical protein n=1 Tax=Aminipila sp. TaxID=2060095 RepID=UPI00289B0EAA|nr:hypothetical protein [Aminipila sp.]